MGILIKQNGNTFDGIFTTASIHESYETLPLPSELPPARGKTKGKRFYILAGLLTYFVERLPSLPCPSCEEQKASGEVLFNIIRNLIFARQTRFLRSSILPKSWFRHSLQQRVCSGFTPDSLFIRRSEQNGRKPKLGAKVKSIF